jgi:hypothetical protein
VITGWLVKIAIGIAVAGLLFVEVGSPLITRAQVDGAAHDAADDAAAEFFQHPGSGEDAARNIAQQVADDKGMTMEAFSVDDAGVHVTFFKQARSVVLKRFSQTRSWYQIRVRASSAGPGK